MHDLAFADATRPTPVRVLGLTLRPYSIGHEVILLRERNALLWDESEFNALRAGQQFAALSRAVLVCSRDWRTNHNSNHREPWLGLWLWTARKFRDLALAVAEFRNYRRSAQVELPCSPIPSDETGRALGSPHLGMLFLHSGCNWDCPLGQAIWLHGITLERAGSIYLTNSTDEEESAIRAEIAADPAAQARVKALEDYFRAQGKLP